LTSTARSPTYAALAGDGLVELIDRPRIPNPTNFLAAASVPEVGFAGGHSHTVCALAVASGAGAMTMRSIGTIVLGGMVAATFISTCWCRSFLSCWKACGRDLSLSKRWSKNGKCSKTGIFRNRRQEHVATLAANFMVNGKFQVGCFAAGAASTGKVE